MLNIGSKIYFDNITGEVVLRTSEKSGEWARQSTLEEDINGYQALSERNRDTFDVLELEFGMNQRDFAECNGYRVNVELLATLPQDRRHEALEFSYPDPENPTEPPVFQKPLTEQITELKVNQFKISRAVDEASTTQQQLLELLSELGVI